MCIRDRYCGLDIAYFNELKDLLELWELPTKYEYKNTKQQLVEYLFSDKKSSNKTELNFVLLTSIGNAIIYQFNDSDVDEILYCLEKS